MTTCAAAVGSKLKLCFGYSCSCEAALAAGTAAEGLQYIILTQQHCLASIHLHSIRIAGIKPTGSLKNGPLDSLQTLIRELSLFTGGGDANPKICPPSTISHYVFALPLYY